MPLHNPKPCTEFLSEQIAETDSWWGDGIFGPGFRLLLTGKGGSRKSFFALGLGLELCSTREGSEYLNLDIENRKKGLYINFEINARGLQERLTCMTHGKQVAEYENLHIINSYDFKLENSTDKAQLISIVEEGEYNFVIMDCMYKMHNLEENNEQHMKAVLEVFEYFISIGVSVILVHHHAKHAEQSRGSSVITDWADTVIALKNSVVHFEKVRHAEQPDEIHTIFDDHLTFKKVGLDLQGSTDRSDKKITDNIVRSIMETAGVTKMSQTELGAKIEHMGLAHHQTIKRFIPDASIFKIEYEGKSKFYVLK